MEQIQKAEPGEESKLVVRRSRERDSEHHLCLDQAIVAGCTGV